MKFISIDIETTGLDPLTCQILELSAVIVDTEKSLDQFKDAPKFECIIDNGDKIQGEPYAISMNARIFTVLAGMKDVKPVGDQTPKDAREAYRKSHNIIPVNLVAREFWDWLYINNMVECDINDLMKGHHVKIEEGKSVPIKKTKTHITACGKNFGTFDLQFLKQLPQWSELIRVRSRIIDPATLLVTPNDKDLPGLKTCMERAGLKGDVTHNALQDAIDTAYCALVGLNKLWK